ncbi:MAG: LptF/LptG family permease [Pseudomonadota bacterium]
MTRMQRYIYYQTLRTLLIIIVGLVLMALLAEGLSRTDLIVENRQSALTYLKVVALGAPQVISLLLPLAVFVASVWTLNRIHRDSEIVVAQAAGMTHWGAVSPILRLAAMVALVHLGINLWVQPAAQTEMRATISEARANLATTLIRPGQFTHIGDDLTFFARENRGGRLSDIFISDASDPDSPIDYLAQTGAFARVANAPAIVMQDGQILERDEAGGLSILDFQLYAFSLAEFDAGDSDLVLKASDRTLDDLFFVDSNNYVEMLDVNRYYAEGHLRLSSPLISFVMALLAVAAILRGDFSRRGYSGRVMVATAGALGIVVLQMAAAAIATGAPILNLIQWAVPAGAVLTIVASGALGRRLAKFRLDRANQRLGQSAPA